MIFVLHKTKDGAEKGNLKFYCRMLEISRQGFYKFLSKRNRPWKYQIIADAILEILAEDPYNDRYGRVRMRQALVQKLPEGTPIPSERTIYRIMQKLGVKRETLHKPKGITKADREAQKSDDLLKRDFHSDKPGEKCVTDITEIKCKDAKLYVSAIFDCFDLCVLGLSMDTNMKASLCAHTLENAIMAHPEMKGGILHSDRGSQYTSELFRNVIQKSNVTQSMNSAGGRCHDNARCESMWARMKSELLYDRYNTEKMLAEDVKTLVWRYFMSYWNNRRISSGNGGMAPIVKRKKYYETVKAA